MADKKISELTPLTGALNVADALPIADDSASQTKKISPKELLERAFVLIDDDSIPASKIDSSGGIPPGAVGTTELADGSVTAIKLADNSSGVVGATLPASGVRIGQVALETTANKFYCWNGSAWVPVKAGGSVNTITGVTGTRLEVVVTQSGDSVTVETKHVDTNNAGEFLAGPTNSGGSVSARRIVGTDIPTADASNKGGIKVSGEGLRLDGEQLEIDNDVTANNAVHLCQYNTKGLVTNSRPIDPSDLPIATSTKVGVVMPTGDLIVGAGGGLSLGNKGVAGTHTKVTCNAQGVITAGSVLNAGDLPSIPGDKITGNSLDGAALADKSVIKAKLANYSISYIQEAQPAITSADHIGILWYQESTAQLRMWNSNSWMPVGFGRLSNENLRWGGLIDASTGLLTGVTAAGTTAGLTIGSALPEATDALGGLYVLVSVAGDQIGVITGQSFDAGDWALCINEAEGWVRIDTATGGGGGGGGATTLNDLLDVQLTSPEENQFLSLGSGGQWTNVSVINGGGF